MYDVLAVSSSPRGAKGNSTILLTIAVKKLTESGLSVFSFDCAETRIEPCKGCLRCNQTGVCVQDDVFSKTVLPVFKECYGVLLASPVYFWDVSAQLKSFIDRFRVAIQVKVERERIVCKPKYTRHKDVIAFFAQGEVRSSHYSGGLNAIRAFTEGACGGKILDTVVAKAVPLSQQLNVSEERLKKYLTISGVDADDAYIERLLQSYEQTKSHALKAAEKLAESIVRAKSQS